MHPTIDDVLESFRSYYQERETLQHCLDGCEYDAGWHCRHEHEAVTDAKQFAELCLNAYIDARIEAKLGAKP